MGSQRSVESSWPEKAGHSVKKLSAAVCATAMPGAKHASVSSSFDESDFNITPR